MSSPETDPTDPVDDHHEPVVASSGGSTDQTATDPTELDQTEHDQTEHDQTPPDQTPADPTQREQTGLEESDGTPQAHGEPAAERPLLSDLPPLTLLETVEPVRRRRGRVKRTQAADDAETVEDPPMPSLTSPLLSGRSLEPTRPRRRFEVLRDHPRWLIALGVAILVVVGLVTGKILAERAADSAMAARSAELEELLADATPQEFLAFSSGVNDPGSLAERTRDLDGFVNVQATADRSFIRFQPSGWWSGFTERCLVAVVREDGVTVTVPKTACIRVEAPPS